MGMAFQKYLRGLTFDSMQNLEKPICKNPEPSCQAQAETGNRKQENNVKLNKCDV